MDDIKSLVTIITKNRCYSEAVIVNDITEIKRQQVIYVHENELMLKRDEYLPVYHA